MRPGPHAASVGGGRRAERGFSIVAAVFILVVMAGLGAFIVSTSSSQQMGLALDVLGSRARQAARTGIDWATYQVVKLPGGGFAAACEAANFAAPSAPSVLTALPGLEGFRVEVTCGSEGYTEDGAYRLYRITATACNDGVGCLAAATPGVAYVEHQQVAVVKNP